MTKPPRINFMREGIWRDIPNINCIPREERIEAYERQLTGWLGLAYYVNGVPVMTV